MALKKLKVKEKSSIWWNALSESSKVIIGMELAAFILTLLPAVSPSFWMANDIKNRLYYLLRCLNSTAFWLAFLMTACFTESYIKKRFFKKTVPKHSKTFYLSWIICFLLCLPYIPILFGYETTQIGDFYEATEYTEKYYVIMSTKPESVSNRKKYTLPAEIERRYDLIGTTDLYEDYYSQSYGGEDIYELNYHINHLYFPNGGYLSFDYDYAYEEISCSKLQINQETKVTDNHDNYYYIKLTKEKVK